MVPWGTFTATTPRPLELVGGLFFFAGNGLKCSGKVVLGVPEVLLGDRGQDKLQIVLVGFIEGIKLITVDVEYELGLAVVNQRHDDLRFGQDAACYMARKLFNVRH